MQRHSLVICHAPADAVLVGPLAEFLSSNLSLEISFDTSLPLLGAVERSLSAPFALALLSAASVPEIWKRPEWEPIFLKAPEEYGSHLGFGLLNSCRFPELLRRERFFDFTEGFLEPARMVKQWIMRPGQMPRKIFGHSALRAELSDHPGTVQSLESSDPFLTECALDFEQVCRVDANGRSVAGILGETGHQLGKTLPENATRNRELLVEYLAQNRVLLIYDNLPAEHLDLVSFGGLASVVTTIGPSPVISEPDMATLPERVKHSLRKGWEVCEYLGPLQRFAEKIEVLEMMAEVARRKGDKMGLYSIEHELFFMRDEPHADAPILPSAPTDAGQLSLF